MKGDDDYCRVIKMMTVAAMMMMMIMMLMLAGCLQGV
jgi:hypothetical protein